MASRRPLPMPPGQPMGPHYNQYTLSRPSDMYTGTNPYYQPYSYNGDYDEQPNTTLPAGTLLHKGFYDLLAMIPTPSPSRMFWGPPEPPKADPVIAGPRYEDLSAGPPPTVVQGRNAPYPSSPPLSPVSGKKGRRISKDMVSKPTGFV